MHAFMFCLLSPRVDFTQFMTLALSLVFNFIKYLLFQERYDTECVSCKIGVKSATSFD